MTRLVQWALAAWFLGFGFWMFFTPMSFYQLTPDVADMGPFNRHFVMDIGLVFFASGGAMAYGIYRQDKTAIVCGTLWPMFHAIFHIFIWFQRGVPFDFVAFSNLFSIQLPAWAAFVLALKFTHRSNQYA
ncbi:hypothetical protein [Maritalea mediterranea]|uniref:DUF4345 domain-containing protein n=1 Tax=Maritalea mediterranea TaxID=2909667 RepID=A0ABS9ECU0_9HYPH|nr:hypothetical protein [Maritalea mediterranea]MCF4099243.1 hypothetical protein [Maritalea mediterranea]